MPSIKFFGYTFYCWSNEYSGDKLEPVHIHVTKGVPSANGPKWWIGYNKICQAEVDTTMLKAHDIKQSEIREIESIMLSNCSQIIEMWANHFSLKAEQLEFHNSVK